MVVGLDRPQADREAQHGIAKGLNDGSTVRLSGHLRRREEEYRSSGIRGDSSPFPNPFLRKSRYNSLFSEKRK